MKRLNVDITEEEYVLLKEKAENEGVTIAFLLGCFIADLTRSENSGGSDEREYANNWLHRASLKYR
ncbi:hypothetical protein ABC255_08630 [Neobacillus sp. 3P2-tot-E-2]|uniref:hypothetical protein n=1 Tax=Neobacillus sp. 3P2-tot-E-2 TaxID=3132212 RepID=UPI0039A1B2B6